MSREYYLHKRKSGVYYVEFVDPASGRKLSARSTRERDPINAQVKAELWKINGLPAGRLKKPRPLEEAAGIESVIRAIRKSVLNADDALRIVQALKTLGLIDIAAVKNTGFGAVPFAQFLESFWDYDKSEYIQDKLAHGFRFSRQHARECQKRLKAELAPFFGDKKQNCIATEDLSALSKQLAARGLSTSTINQVLLVATTPLKWAHNKKIIPEDPTLGLMKFSIVNKERGILTEAEAAAVFSVEWKDKRAFVASLVAATTGARQGECLALRLSDIKEDTLTIMHSYSPLDGLKSPKNGHKRVVPLLPAVKAALLGLLEGNPHLNSVENPFVFYSLHPGKPCDPKIILNGFKDAMDAANREMPGIQIDYKGRNIIFHSWRHWFCSKITERIEGEKVAKVSGHLSESVFKKYADHIEHKNIQEVGEAAAQAFGGVLRFAEGR